MKSLFKALLLLFCTSVAISCSNKDEAFDEYASGTRADSPLLVVAPTGLHFDESNGYTQTVNIKTAGVSSLAILNSFDLVIQGADADQFSATRESLSIIQILQALLGNGVNVTVTYEPDAPGQHQATLLINAALLGIIAPLQTTVPLEGNSSEGGPKVVSTVPQQGDQNVNGETTEFEINYDQNITIVDQSLISFNGNVSQVVAEVDGNKLIVRYLTLQNYIESDVEYTVLVKAGAIRGADGKLTTEDYRLTFKTTDNTPVFLYSIPANGTIIYYEDAITEKDVYITLKFDRPVEIGTLNSGGSGVRSQIIPFTSIRTNPADSTIVVQFRDIYPFADLGIVIEEHGVYDSNGNQNLQSTTLGFPTRVGGAEYPDD